MYNFFPEYIDICKSYILRETAESSLVLGQK